MKELEFINACRSGNIEKVVELINEVDLNFKNIHGETALISAINSGNTIIIDKLFELAPYGAIDLDIQNNVGESALLLCPKHKNDYVAEKLIDLGASLNIQDINGSTVLMKSIVTNRHHLTKKIIESGACLDIQNSVGKTALIYASRHAYNINVVDNLLKFNADVNIEHNDGLTALIGAVCSGCIQIAELLIKNGANPDFKNTYGNTAHLYALNNVQLMYLLNNDILNKQDEDGSTILLKACEAKNEPGILFLHEMAPPGGADFHIKNNK